MFDMGICDDISRFAVLQCPKKLNALTDARHSDEEIGRPLAEIDEEIRKAEALLRHNLSFRRLLRP